MRKLMSALFLAFFVMAATAGAGEGIKEGAPPPNFVLLDENNRSVDLATVLDRPTIMYFTHNACFYCTQIILYLKRAEEKFGSEHLRIIGINIMAKDQKLIRAYKEALGFTFPMFAGNREDVLRAYRINYVPVIIFVDSKKIVRKVVGHYIHEDELFKNIQGIMK
jgi:thioredoxin-related protein